MKHKLHRLKETLQRWSKTIIENIDNQVTLATKEVKNIQHLLYQMEITDNLQNKNILSVLE